MEETKTEKTEKYFIEDSIVYLGKSPFFIAEYKQKVFLLEYDAKLIQDGFLEEHTVGYKMLIGGIEPHISMPLEIAKKHLSYFPQKEGLSMFNKLPEIDELCIFWGETDESFCVGLYHGFCVDNYYKLSFRRMVQGRVVEFPYVSTSIRDHVKRLIGEPFQ